MLLDAINHITKILYRLYISKVLHCNYLVYTLGRTRIVGSRNIHVGKALCMDTDVKLEAWNSENPSYSSQIIIGDRVFLNSRTHISAIQTLKIGNDVLIGSDVIICDNNHGRCESLQDIEVPPRKRSLFSKGPIIIQDNVWIGDKVIVLGGVTIGKGAVIGAGSVVTTDIPAFSVAVGNPARIIRVLK